MFCFSSPACASNIARCTSGSFCSEYAGATSMPPIVSSNTSIVVGSSRLIFASGHSSFGSFNTNVGWISVGSIFFEKISFVISNSSHVGLTDSPSFSAPAIFSALLRANHSASPVASRIRSL